MHRQLPLAIYFKMSKHINYSFQNQLEFVFTKLPPEIDSCFILNISYPSCMCSWKSCFSVGWPCETSESAIPLLQNTQMKQISRIVSVSPVIMKEEPTPVCIR